MGGPPLSPVLAHLFMAEFEKTALLSADFKPTVLLRDIDEQNPRHTTVTQGQARLQVKVRGL